MIDTGVGAGTGASAGFSDKGKGVDGDGFAGAGDGFTGVGAVPLATQPPANNTKVRKTIIPMDNTLLLKYIVPPHLPQMPGISCPQNLHLPSTMLFSWISRPFLKMSILPHSGQ